MNSSSTNGTSTHGNGVARSVALWAALGLCAVSLYLCYRVIGVMERAVTVMERVDTKIDRGIASSKAAIDRSKELINPAEEERLKSAAKNKAAEIGGKARAWIDRNSQ